MCWCHKFRVSSYAYGVHAFQVVYWTGRKSWKFTCLSVCWGGRICCLCLMGCRVRFVCVWVVQRIVYDHFVIVWSLPCVVEYAFVDVFFCVQ